MIEKHSGSMLPEINTTPGDEVKRILAEKELTQLDFYEATGMLNSDLSKIISGKMTVTPKKAKLLSEGFKEIGVHIHPVNWLFYQAVKDLRDYEAK